MKIEIVETKEKGNKVAVVNKVEIEGKVSYVVECMDGNLCEGYRSWNSIQFARSAAKKYINS